MLPVCVYVLVSFTLIAAFSQAKVKPTPQRSLRYPAWRFLLLRVFQFRYKRIISVDSNEGETASVGH